MEINFLTKCLNLYFKKYGKIPTEEEFQIFLNGVGLLILLEGL